jgi:hypothetical protein
MEIHYIYKQVKVYLNNTPKRFNLTSSFEEFKRNCELYFDLEQSAEDHQVSYIDHDEDIIIISSQYDYDQALKYSQIHDIKEMKIYLENKVNLISETLDFADKSNSFPSFNKHEGFPTNQLTRRKNNKRKNTNSGIKHKKRHYYENSDELAIDNHYREFNLSEIELTYSFENLKNSESTTIVKQVEYNSESKQFNNVRQGIENIKTKVGNIEKDHEKISLKNPEEMKLDGMLVVANQLEKEKLVETVFHDVTNHAANPGFEDGIVKSALEIIRKTKHLPKGNLNLRKNKSTNNISKAQLVLGEESDEPCKRLLTDDHLGKNAVPSIDLLGLREKNKQFEASKAELRAIGKIKRKAINNQAVSLLEKENNRTEIRFIDKFDVSDEDSTISRIRERAFRDSIKCNEGERTGVCSKCLIF